VEDTSQVKDVADLRGTLELYHALLNGGQPGGAMRLYYDRLQEPLCLALGAYAAMGELLSPLFTHGFDQPPALSAIDAQAFAANDLALAFDNLGDLAQAHQLYVVCIHLALEKRNANNVARGLDNLAWSLEDGGQLAAAERANRLSRGLAQA